MLLKHPKIILFVCLVLLSWGARAQYKYTRYSVDVNGGLSFPKTSISGTSGAYSEIGLRIATSKYLSGRLALGYGTLSGSQKVEKPVAQLYAVQNYTKFNVTYYYFSGNGMINLERLFKLRNLGRRFGRINPFLVIGAGYMFPDINVVYFGGNTKNYKDNVRFIHNNFGLDFKCFLSNRFDLNFGGEYRLVQSYYLDGAYSDKVLDGFFNGYIGLAYNIGANADKKHMEWFNLDGKVDIQYVPFKQEDIKPTIPIVKENDPIQDSLALLEEKQRELDEKLAQQEAAKSGQDTIDIKLEDPKLAVNNDTVSESIIAKNAPSQQDSSFKKVGRHTDIRYDNPRKEKPTEQPVVVAKKDTASIPAPTKVVTTPASGTNLNDIDGVVPPLGKYSIIVGTYAGPKYAFYFRNKLRKEGFQAAIFRDNLRSKMHRVAVYYGADRAEANRQLRRYLAKFNSQAWIHVYDKK